MDTRYKSWALFDYDIFLTDAPAIVLAICRLVTGARIVADSAAPAVDEETPLGCKKLAEHLLRLTCCTADCKKSDEGPGGVVDALRRFYEFLPMSWQMCKPRFGAQRLLAHLRSLSIEPFFVSTISEMPYLHAAILGSKTLSSDGMDLLNVSSDSSDMASPKFPQIVFDSCGSRVSRLPPIRNGKILVFTSRKTFAEAARDLLGDACVLVPGAQAAVPNEGSGGSHPALQLLAAHPEDVDWGALGLPSPLTAPASYPFNVSPLEDISEKGCAERNNWASVIRSSTATGSNTFLPEVTLVGKVVKGFGRGSSQLGVPTANLDLSSRCPSPPALIPGVYYGHAWFLEPPANSGDFNQYCASRRFGFVMSIGYNPYFENAEMTYEVHLFEKFNEDFYGSSLKVAIRGMIRVEAKFPRFEHLVQAIQNDCEVARRCLEVL